MLFIDASAAIVALTNFVRGFSAAWSHNGAAQI
jgi:hypothetical protein